MIFHPSTPGTPAEALQEIIVVDDGSWPPLSVELHDINPKMIITYSIYMQEWCGCGQIVEKKATILSTSFSYSRWSDMLSG